MNLERYIEQLLSDIETATEHVPDPWYEHDEEEEEFGLLPWMEDIENAPRKSLEEWSGLKRNQFPPEQGLTDDQVSYVLTAIKKMLDAYNCSAVFQINVPERIQYHVITARFNQQVPILKANYFFFEFCDKQNEGCDRSNCLLGEEYCHCNFFDAFFERFDNNESNSEGKESSIDPYEEYMLRKRYGDKWYRHIRFDEPEDNFSEDPDMEWDDELDESNDIPF